MTLQEIIDKYWDASINSMTVKEAKHTFDVVYEHVMDDCLEHDVQQPNWDESFGIWCGVI